MKKLFGIAAAGAAALSLAACGGSNYDGETFTYVSKYGAVEVPVNAERIVILDTTAAGSIIKFGEAGTIVGHEYWVGTNPLYNDGLVNSVVVDETSVEAVAALDPDLIITWYGDTNISSWKSLAPTVEFGYGDYNYLDAIVEYAKVIGKGEEATNWVTEFKDKTALLGEEVRATHGEDTTITVYEAWGDTLYLYGDNWGRGSQIVYQEMGLKMPDNVKTATDELGYFAISAEVIPDYAGDFIILSQFEGAEVGFLETATWTNIPAVQNGQVIQANAEEFYMVGPITLENQYTIIKDFFDGLNA